MYGLQNHIYLNISPKSDMKTFYTDMDIIQTVYGYDPYLCELHPYGSYPHYTLHFIHIFYKD